MAYNNKVCYNIDQTGDTTSAEKKQARDNIEASQVNYINAISPTPTTTHGDLNLVTYQSGLHLNDGVGNIAPCLPEPTSANNGQIATVTSEGVKWKANQPPKDVFIKTVQFETIDIGTNTTLVKSLSLPTRDGKYPTKVVGSIDCYPHSGYETLSIVPLYGISDVYQPVDEQQNVNTDHLLALSNTQTQPSDRGDYRNEISFCFRKADDHNLSFIGIKGMAGSSELDYHIHNANITCFYEYEEENP